MKNKRGGQLTGVIHRRKVTGMSTDVPVAAMPREKEQAFRCVSPNGIGQRESANFPCDESRLSKPSILVTIRFLQNVKWELWHYPEALSVCPPYRWPE